MPLSRHSSHKSYLPVLIPSSSQTSTMPDHIYHSLWNTDMPLVPASHRSSSQPEHTYPVIWLTVQRSDVQTLPSMARMGSPPLPDHMSSHRCTPHYAAHSPRQSLPPFMRSRSTIPSVVASQTTPPVDRTHSPPHIPGPARQPPCLSPVPLSTMWTLSLGSVYLYKSWLCSTYRICPNSSLPLSQVYLYS